MIRGSINRLLLAALGAVAALWLTFWWYSGQNTFPAGVRLGEWYIGGLTEQQFRLQLHERMTRLYDEPVQLAFAGTASDSTVFSLASLGLSADLTQLDGIGRFFGGESRLDKAKRRWSMRNTALPFTLLVSQEKLTQTLTAAWPDRTNPPTSDAERLVTAEDQISYTPEQRAQAIDLELLAEQLVQAGHERFYRSDAVTGQDSSASAAIQVPMREKVPSVTLDMLKAQGIERKIAEFTTTFTGGAPGRIHNIRATAATIHDKLLAPGEQFDYGEVVRATEQHAGYREAPVIYNGKLVPGVGGGICQVSTTLYNAILLAGLHVDERRNHSLPVSYISLGLDATFATGYINFRFTNNSGSYLLIRTETDESRITVKLFGSMPDLVTYEMETRVLQVLEPTVKYVLNPTLPVGAQNLLQQGKPGYIVETYRIRKENGIETSRERVSQDRYQPQPSLVAVHGRDPSPNGQDGPRGGARSIVEDGVSGPTFLSDR